MTDLILPLEKQVSTLESSIILRDLGVPQRSLFYWKYATDFSINKLPDIFKDYKPEIISEKWIQSDASAVTSCSAFTVAELGELLGDRFHSNMENKRAARRSGWYCKRFGNSYDDSCIEFALTEAEARAKMLIYLIKNKLMEVPK